MHTATHTLILEQREVCVITMYSKTFAAWEQCDFASVRMCWVKLGERNWWFGASSLKY